MSCPNRVLIVDDNVDLCWTLQHALCHACCETTVVNNGEESLTAVSQGDFSIAFIDAKLGDIDGLSLATEIKKLCSCTTIVLISGFYYREDPDVVRAFEEGIIDFFLAKPFDLCDLETVVSGVLEESA